MVRIRKDHGLDAMMVLSNHNHNAEFLELIVF